MILDPLAALAVGLLTAAGVMAAVLTALWWLDRCDHEPVQLLLLAGLWGAVAAPVARFALRAWLSPPGPSLPGGPLASAGTVIAIAVFGEGLKGLGVALLGRRLDGPTDGLLLGFAAGLGWAVLDGALALASAGPRGTGTGTVVTALLAVVAGAGVSALATGALGGLLGLGRLAGSRLWRALWPAGGIALAVVLHAGWKGVSVTLASVAAGPGPWLLALVAVACAGVAEVGLFLRAEGRVLVSELQEEAEWRVVPAWVVEVIPSYRRRVRGDWWPERGGRVVIARLLSRLGLRKRALRRLTTEAGRLPSLEVGRLRSRVRGMLLPLTEDHDREG